jgi:peptide/nickel transport system permease protein
MPYLLRQVVRLTLVVLGVLTIVFGLMYLSGDPVAVLAPPDATQEDLAELRRLLGFDRPLGVQYLDFLAHAVRGDFGTSVRYQVPALPFVLSRLPATALLAGAALVWMLAIAIPTGILSALRPGTWIDTVSRLTALAGQSLPSFWLGIVLIFVFAVQLRVLPVSGLDGWRSLVLPSFTLGVIQAATLSRVLRSSLLDALQRDYVRTARSKGLRGRAVIVKHALRNATIPALAILGVQIGFLLSGAVVVEQVFAYPGMGRLVLQAVGNRDVPVVQAFVFVTAIVVALVNLLLDVVYTLVDPRIRYG